jgi:hypothetical protein
MGMIDCQVFGPFPPSVNFSSNLGFPLRLVFLRTDESIDERVTARYSTDGFLDVPGQKAAALVGQLRPCLL